MRHRTSLVYDSRELGEAVRHARRQADLTQDELAGRLGVSRMTVSRMESGDSVSVETVLRALSECGFAVAVAPKFSRVSVESDASPVSSSEWSSAAGATGEPSSTSRDEPRVTRGG